MTNPFFSIIVPTYNRRQQLNNCLEALARLAYPSDCFEVIVVDDGSDKSMSVIVEKYQNLLSVTLLTQANSGPGGARNTGAARARGRFLAFTDDDCQPDSGWLTALAERFSSERDIAVGGCTINALSDNLFSVTSQYIHDQVQAHYNQNPFEAHFFASNNLAMSKDLFFSIGGFDNIRFPNASEDRDLCSRWLEHGYRMVYAPEALVRHTHHLSMGRFLLQHFRYGIGAFSFHLACKQRHPGHKIVKMPFYHNVLRDLTLMTGNTRKCRLAAGLILWQAANTAGFLWEAAKHLTRPQKRIGEGWD
jgi:GT2 family glycosyltransferase